MVPAPRHFSEIGRLRSGAHHPDCSRYDHHLLRLAGHPLCLGCVALWAGAGLGAAGAWMARPSQLAPLPTLLTCATLALPAFLQPFTRTRWVKFSYRLAVGVGSGLLWSGVVLTPWPWAWRAAGAFMFLAIYRAARVLRQRHLDNPCTNCPFGTKPFCTHYLPQFEALLAARRGAGSLEEAELLAGLVQAIREREAPLAAQTA